MPTRMPLGENRRGTVIVSVLMGFGGVATIAVALRLWARKIMKKHWRLDDYFILNGLMWVIATAGIGNALVMYGGVGLHMADLAPERIVLCLKLFTAALFTWGTAITSIKMSILSFYVDMFPSIIFRRSVYTVMAIQLVLFLVLILESVLVCQPFAFNWDKTIPGGHCGSLPKTLISYAVLNMAEDVAIWALPMPILWNLHMSRSKKLGVTAVLSLGLTVCIVAGIRIAAVANELDAADFTYTVVSDILLAGVEVEVGTINACLPLLPPVLRRLVKRTGSGVSPTAARGTNTRRSRVANQVSNRLSQGRDMVSSQSSTIGSGFCRLNDELFGIRDPSITGRTYSNAGTPKRNSGIDPSTILTQNRDSWPPDPNTIIMSRQFEVYETPARV